MAQSPLTTRRFMGRGRPSTELDHEAKRILGQVRDALEAQTFKALAPKAGIGAKLLYSQARDGEPNYPSPEVMQGIAAGLEQYLEILTLLRRQAQRVADRQRKERNGEEA